MVQAAVKRGAILVVLTLGLSVMVFGVGRARARAQNAQQTPAASQAEDKPVEQTHKNIQVLKGMPDSQLIPMMQLFTASLGVRCDACHVRTEGKWEFDKDDKKMKQTARKMIQMTMDINKANFEGHPDVSCFACHRGSERPVAVPPLPLPAETRAEGPKPAEQWPTAQQVVAKYLQAVGTKESAEKVKTRSITGSFVLPDGNAVPMEMLFQSPDKLLSVLTMKQGAMTMVLDGGSGWTKNERETRPLNPIEIDRLKSLALSLEPFQLKEPYPRMVFGGKEKIGDHDAYRIGLNTPDKKRVRLYFDVQSGLLLRRIVLRDTIVGADPEQTDYDDYRDVDGVKMPFSIRVSYASNNISGTRKLTEVKTNVTVDASKFAMPK